MRVSHSNNRVSVIYMMHRVCRTSVNITLIQLAIELGAPIDKGACTYLEAAVYEGDIKRVSFLVSAGADVNRDFGYPLMRACHSERVDIIDILINAGADVNPGPIRYIQGIRMWNTIPNIDDAILYRSPIIMSKLLVAGAVLPNNAMDLAHRSNKCRTEKIKMLSEHYKIQECAL